MDFVLKSGAKLTVSMAPFAVGNKIKKIFLLSGKSDVDLLTNEALEEQFWLAAQSAIYEGAKINQSLFDDLKLGLQAKRDYAEIFNNIVQFNLEPFFPAAANSGSSTQPEVKA